MFEALFEGFALLAQPVPLGWLVLGGGLALDALGWWWMRRITRGALP